MMPNGNFQFLKTPLPPMMYHFLRLGPRIAYGDRLFVELGMLTQATIALSNMPINAVDLRVMSPNQEPSEDSCECLNHYHPCHVL